MQNQKVIKKVNYYDIIVTSITLINYKFLK